MFLSRERGTAKILTQKLYLSWFGFRTNIVEYLHAKEEDHIPVRLQKGWMRLDQYKKNKFLWSLPVKWRPSKGQAPRSGLKVGGLNGGRFFHAMTEGHFQQQLRVWGALSADTIAQFKFYFTVWPEKTTAEKVNCWFLNCWQKVGGL